MHITVAAQPDAGQEIIAMLCGLATEQQGVAREDLGRMRRARNHFLASPKLATLGAALDALTAMEEHVLSGITIDDEHLMRLFTAPADQDLPACVLYEGLQHGLNAKQCAAGLITSLKDGDYFTLHDGKLPELTLDEFVRQASALGFDRDYVWNLTRMLADWEADCAFLRALIDKAIPRFESCLPQLTPFLTDWAATLTARIPQMERSGFICASLKPCDGDYQIVPALRAFSSLILRSSFPGEPQCIRYGLLFDAICSIAPEVEDSQLLTSLRALGDKRRLKIMRALLAAPRYASELAALTELSPATVSHHMAELINAGLITVEDAGNRVNRVRYHVSEEGCRAFVSSLSALLLSRS